MLLFNSFIFCGFVCMISQIVLDNSKLTPGHITSILVVIGAFLDSFGVYDMIITTPLAMILAYNNTCLINSFSYNVAFFVRRRDIL